MSSDFCFKLVEWDRAKTLGSTYERFETNLPCVGDGALYEGHACTILVTTTEEWEWGQLTLELDCEGPPDNHWLSYEFDTVGGLGDILDISGDQVDMFLLENGIAPFQRFYLYITAHYYKDYWGEYDSEIECEVLNVEPWDVNRVCTEWEAYWARKRIIMPWCPSP
jgi:hypothetical protein